MAFGLGFFIVAALVAGIWVFIEFKRLRHKLFAIALMALIIFTYVSFSVTIKSHDVDLKTASGWITAGKLYFSWLGSVFHNTKVLTAQAVKLDWSADNSTVSSG